MSQKAVIRQIKVALETLASPADKQLAYVRGLGVGNDELALEFDDVSGTRRTLLADGTIDRDQADAIAAVERRLTSITRAGAARWTDIAITTGEDWREVRELAVAALGALT
jgi:hypothetical protein